MLRCIKVLRLLYLLFRAGHCALAREWRRPRMRRTRRTTRRGDVERARTVPGPVGDRFR